MEFDGQKASYIVISLGIVGFTLNCNLAYAVKKSPSFGYAFGTLMFSQMIANIGNLLISVFFLALLTLIQPEWHDTYWGRRSGQLLVFFFYASTLTHFLAAVNRALVINFPIKASRFYNEPHVTKISLVVIWLLAFGMTAVYAFPVCSMSFDPTVFLLSYANSSCGYITEHYVDIGISMTVVSLIVVIDAISFCSLRRLHTVSPRRRSREIRFFTQACIQSGVLVLTTMCFFYLYALIDNPWYVFMMTIFVWELAHCLDGLVVLLFNSEVRKILRRIWIRSDARVTVGPASIAFSNPSRHPS